MDVRVEKMPTYCRALTDNELSYFLPSRANGANDMMLQLKFRAPAVLITHWRISLAWAILRMQHPFLASRIETTPGEYHTAKFVYVPPASPQDAVLEAQSNLEIRFDRTGDELADDTVNEARMLSTERTSYLRVAENAEDSSPVREYCFVVDLAHYSTDGVSVHAAAHILLTLLGGSAAPGKPIRSDEDLEALLQNQWEERWLHPIRNSENVMPAAAESRLPPIANKFKAVASKLEFEAKQKRFIGGHTFPRITSKTQKCVTSNMSFTAAETAVILAKCRAERVTVSNAMFAICAFAWIRTMQKRTDYDPRLPIMMYSAVNLRHLFSKPDTLQKQTLKQPFPGQLESFVFLAVSYFNAVLPAFIPSTSPESAIFWGRARSIRQQFLKYMRSPMLIPRVHHMTLERGNRARRFALEDDQALLGSKSIVSTHQSASKTLAAATAQSKPKDGPPPVPSNVAQTPEPRAPSVALIGLSQLNNLDEVYLADSYPSIDVFFVVGHTRKNKGGMLLFTHTFRSQLYVMLGWDKPGFKPGVVERFWESVQECIREFMIVDETRTGREVKL